MDHYVDMDIRPDPEFPVYQLINALYSKLHRALVAMENTAIGVSFPGFNLKAPHLGARLRLHGSVTALSTLFVSDWLTGMRDHVAVTQPLQVPDNVHYRSVRRVQVKSSPERLRRRLMRRQNVDEQEALLRIPNEVARLASQPFMQMRSTSTSQSFRLFIDHGSIQSKPVSGDFNAYGLSQGATIPWF